MLKSTIYLIIWWVGLHPLPQRASTFTSNLWSILVKFCVIYSSCDQQYSKLPLIGKCMCIAMCINLDHNSKECVISVPCMVQLVQIVQSQNKPGQGIYYSTIGNKYDKVSYQGEHAAKQSRFRKKLSHHS